MLTRIVYGVVFGVSVAVTGCGGDEPSSPNGAGASTTGNGGGNAGAAVGGNAGSASGSGGAPGGISGNGGSAPGSGPADESSASMASFLTAKTYTSAPWVPETASPRNAGAGLGSPHGLVRVYFNDVLLQSLRAGNGQPEQPRVAHTTGSMAVKEFYDDTDTLVGAAAALKIDGAFERWAYYCTGPEERCATGTGSFTAASPLYGVGLQVDCGFCHGGLVFTPPPNWSSCTSARSSTSPTFGSSYSARNGRGNDAWRPQGCLRTLRDAGLGVFSRSKPGSWPPRLGRATDHLDA